GYPTGRIFVDGKGIGDVGQVVLRDRQLLAEAGMVVVALTIDKISGSVVAGPEIASRGFVYMKESDELMEEVKRAVREAAAARAARRARREQGRWVREVKGILALALAGFSGVALFAYEPTLHLLDQSSPVGPVGVWLGWIFFWAFGYAGFLFPLLLAGYGASAFIRSSMVKSWPAGIGLALLLISDTRILTRMSDTLLEQRIHKGGVLGWAVSEALRASVGTGGAWIILLVLIPVAVLLITRISLHVMSGALGGWLRALAF